jgi:hypothetical protein
MIHIKNLTVKNFMSVFNQLAQSGVTLLQSGNIFTALKQISSLGQDSGAGRFVGLLANELNNLIQAGGQLKNFLIPILKDLMDSLSAAANNPSVKAFATAFTELFSVTNKEGQTFHLQFGEIIGFIRTSVSQLVEFLTPIAQVLKKIFDFILPELELALNIMTRTLELANGIKKMFSDIQTASIEPANSAGKSIAGNFSQGLASSMAEASAYIISTVSSNLTKTASYLSSSTAVSDTWQNVGRSIANSISAGYQGGFAGLINSIQEKIGVATIKVATTPARIVGAGSDTVTDVNDLTSPTANYSNSAFGYNNGSGNYSRSGGSEVGGVTQPASRSSRFSDTSTIINNNVTINTSTPDPRDLVATANFLYLKNAFNG